MMSTQPETDKLYQSRYAVQSLGDFGYMNGNN